MTPSPSESPREGAQLPIRRYAVVLAIVALVLAVWGITSRVLFRSALAREAAETAAPVVTTIRASAGPGSEELVLPGSVQAYIEAPIYARTSGYVKSWLTDIGARVKRGEVLAELDTPEVDQQLRQAQADLATAEANAQLALTTNARWQALLATHSVSPQDAESKAGDLAAKQAAAKSAEANVDRLRDLESFKRVVAPFDGVITQRNTDIGALINTGASAGAALFREADTHKLRIYVMVPEPYAGSVRPGVVAELRFAERVGQSYPASVVRTANALDAQQRTLQVELQVDNAAGELFPGAYAEVHLHLPGHNASALRVPVNTLLFRAQGLQVAVVGADHRVILRDITPGRDFGSSMEVLAGIGPQDEVVLNPPDSLAEGTEVRIAPAAGNGRPAGTK